jgi:hypothetical protein
MEFPPELLLTGDLPTGRAFVSPPHERVRNWIFRLSRAAQVVQAFIAAGFGDRGCIATGLRAAVILLRDSDERQLGHQLGGDPVTS